MQRIVVGVDGSPESLAALQWAYDEATAHEAELVVCYAYGTPEAYNPYALAYVTSAGAEGDDVPIPEASSRVATSRESAERVLNAVIGELLPSTPGARVTPLAVEGDRPARTLIELAEGADLLVVGSRGRGGFSGLVLGSVSQQCAQHAPCPVAIIRPTE